MKNSKLKPKKIKNFKFFRFDFLDFILSRKANGFTLIETLVAVTILSAAVAGPMVLSIKNIGLASVSQDQLVAFYLGQEIIEYVRNVRDTNLINDRVWMSGLDECNAVLGCYIDAMKDAADNDAVISCVFPGCPALKFDGANYNYTSGPDTVFTRIVKIDKSVRADGDEAKVDITVSWTGKYGTKTMNLQDNIFNWR